MRDRALVKQLHVRLCRQLEPDRPRSYLFAVDQNAEGHVLLRRHVLAARVVVELQVRKHSLLVDLAPLALARGVHRLDLFEVHALEELQIDGLLGIILLGDVEHLIGGHALAALLRRWFQT